MSDTTRDKEVSSTFLQRLQKKFQLIPLENLSTKKLESQRFVDKFVGALEFFGVWGATYSPRRTKHSNAGLLDFLFLGIPRFLDFVADESKPYFTRNNVLAIFFRWAMLLIGRPLLRLLFFIQQAIGLILTIVATVTFLLPIVHWLYPTSEKSYAETTDKPSETGKKRRQWFFNPSSGVLIFLLLMGIGLWIQSAMPTLFSESAAAPLLILQTVFVGIAGLMLVGGALYLAYSGIAWLLGGDKAGKMPEKKQEPGLEAPAQQTGEKKQPSSPENGIVNYFRELWAWGQSRPHIALPLAVIWGLCISVALILVIGFFADPVSFSFMSNLFDFVGNSFWAGTKNASHLVGLEFLSSISDAALLTFSHIASASTLLCAVIFGPDIFRLGLQYFFPKPDDQNQVQKITSELEDNSESEYIKVIANCDFDHRLWNQQNYPGNSVYQADFSFNKGQVIYLKDRGDGWCTDGGNNAIPFDISQSNLLQKPFGSYEPAIVVNKPPLQTEAGQSQAFNPGDNAVGEKKPWTPTH